MGVTISSLTPKILFDEKIKKSVIKTIIQKSDPHMRLIWISELLTQDNITRLGWMLEQFDSADLRMPREFRTAIQHLYFQKGLDSNEKASNISRQNKKLKERQKILEEQMEETQEQAELIQVRFAEFDSEILEILATRKNLKKEINLLADRSELVTQILNTVEEWNDGSDKDIDYQDGFSDLSESDDESESE